MNVGSATKYNEWEEKPVQKQRDDEFARKMSNLYAGGLIAVDLILLQSMLPAGSSDLTTFIAVLAFSLALPPLTGMLVVNVVESHYPYRPDSSVRLARRMHMLFLFGGIVDLVGICAAFWHFSWIVMLAFLVVFVITFIIYIPYVLRLESRKPERTEKEQD